ncbi:hypothetical protein GYMLUDRAFT_833171 [Collybiopsis luxurians FD-317 M1]|uniref:DUF6534 domain-containing protein n=1 Tax=Collybiopsis luxurians FD-317 M1 TaxID=944289 RepID=A0A0D0CC24_9AGAR|nr:hypothetical protein GYMLUDRAFT_833171 [Collybiopsis luxurians FD-317 M1]
MNITAVMSGWLMPATLQLPGEHEPLDNTMGAMLLGILVSAILYGISLVQAYYYFNRYRQDKWYMKSLVGATILLDTVHLSFIIHTIYHYLITQYYDNEQLNIMIWSVLAEAIPTGVTGGLVQTFYTLRVWRLSKRNYILAVFIMIIVLAQTACGTAWVIISLQLSTFQELLGITGLTISINALSTTADVTIACSLCYLLLKSKTGFKHSDTMINKLIIFVVNTGLATSVCAVASLICLIASPRSLLYAPFYFCIGRLYTNSLLATLNARKGIRNGSEESTDHMMVSLSQVSRDQTAITSSKVSRTPNIAIRIDTAQEYVSDHKTDGSGSANTF